MITKEEIERLGVGDQELKRKCQELDELVEEMRTQNRERRAGKVITVAEQDLPKKEISQADDVRLLDDLGEIRHLLEKASNSLDSF